MNKTTYWLIFWGIAFLMTVLFIISKTVWKQHLWINDLIGLIGVLLSLGGVVMALIQIAQTDAQLRLASSEIDNISKETEKIQLAVEQNRNEIKDFLSISEIVHLEESIRHAQAYVVQESYPIAGVLLQTIKDNLLRTESQFKPLILHLGINLPDIIKNLNLDLETLTKHGLIKKTGNEAPIRPDYIHKHLEEAREATIKIESSLKQKKI